MEKVVKCNGCGQYFMHTEKDTKCPFPFCKTEYVEVDPVRSREGSQRASASNGVEEKAKDKKGLQKLERNLSKFGKIKKA